jgi:hypothetical protein
MRYPTCIGLRGHRAYLTTLENRYRCRHDLEIVIDEFDARVRLDVVVRS